MPKKYYDDIKMVKKKRGSVLHRIWTFIFVILALVLVVVLANLFSNFITMKGLNGGLFASQKYCVIEKRTMYQVSMGEYENPKEASNSANALSLFGAGGYVWQEGDKYYVIGAVYESKKDADSIVAGINNGVYKANTREINFQAIRVDTEDYEEVSKYYNEIYEIYKSVYDISIKVDKGEISYVQAGTMLNDLKSSVSACVAELNDSLSHKIVDSMLLSKYALIKLESSLLGLTNKVLAQEYISYALRYETIYIVEIWHNLNTMIVSI